MLIIICDISYTLSLLYPLPITIISHLFFCAPYPPIGSDNHSEEDLPYRTLHTKAYNVTRRLGFIRQEPWSLEGK